MKPLVFSSILILFLLLLLPQTSFGITCPPDQKECRDSCIPEKSLCLNLNYPKFGGININDPGQQSITAIVAWLYTFFVMFSGLAAFVMIVWGGVQWMTSQGNSTATGDAKDKIQKALLGLLLVLASFLILQIINPELTTLKGIQLPGITPAIPLGAPKETSLILTANGQGLSTRIQPGEDITLAWSAVGSRNCQASSIPQNIWKGSKAPSGSDVVVSSAQEGNYTFSLACFTNTAAITKTVEVVVSSIAVEDGPGPTVILTANGYPKNPEDTNPLISPSLQLPRALVKFAWVATEDADRCIGEDRFSIPSSKQNAQSGDVLISLPSPDVYFDKEYRYTVTCTNLTNGKSGSDTVVITVKKN